MLVGCGARQADSERQAVGAESPAAGCGYSCATTEAKAQVMAA